MVYSIRIKSNLETIFKGVIMSAPAIGSLVLFLLVAIFHLTACFYKNPKYADLSKPLLMPFLALTAVLFLLEKGAPTSTIVILTLALALGTAEIGRASCRERV